MLCLTRSRYPPFIPVLCLIPDKSCKKDLFGKGVIEERQTVASEPASTKKPTPMPISIPSRPVTVDSHLSTLSNPPPSYTTYPEDDRDRVVSPYLDSSSNSSRESSPPSPGPKTPPDKDLSAPSRQACPHRLYQPLGHRNEAR